jgi:filamentous hemagglutinin
MQKLVSRELLSQYASQDGQVHIANNGIMNDLDGAVKYAQQHGGLLNEDGSKNIQAKPVNQYIIFAPVTNNFVSELLTAGYNKTGASVVLGLTDAEQRNADIMRQTAQQGNPMVIDSHSRGTLTTTNAQNYLLNNGGLGTGNGETTTPPITMFNIGSAQNIAPANATLQQLTNNPNASITPIIHPQDIVGVSVFVGNNPATPTYTTTSANGTVTTVTSTNDGKGTLDNAVNVITGTATPHNCYGTAAERDCSDYWKNIPKSNSPEIVVPADQRTRVPTSIGSNNQSQQLQQQTQGQNAQQMNQLQQPTNAPTAAPVPKPATVKVQQLLDFMNAK